MVAVPQGRYRQSNGVRRGVRHLIEKHGRRRIACVRGPENSTEADLRFDAYRETLEQEGVPFEPRLLATGAYVRQDGAAAVSNWLDVEQLSFDAVVAANDAMALGVIDELKRRGIAVPEEVGVIGFDDIGEARHCRPALTTVRQPMREHARAAFGVLWDQLQGKKARQKTNLGSKLVVRRSCGCIKIRNSDDCWFIKTLLSGRAPPHQGCIRSLCAASKRRRILAGWPTLKPLP